MTIPVTTFQPRDFVAPRVTLYRDKPPSPVADALAKLAPRTAAHIAGEIEATTVQREHLETLRADAMLNGTAEDVVALDREITLAKVRLDVATVQHVAAVQAEAEAKAARDEEQARRRAVHKAALKARTSALKLIERYEQQAKALAAILAELQPHCDAIDSANRELPEGVEPIEPPEGFNGQHAENGGPEIVHAALTRSVRLPGMGGRGTPPIW